MKTPNTRVAGLLAAVVMFAMVLAACGGGPSGAAPTAAPTAAPDAAPATSGANAIVEASKNEKDGLLVYSIMSEKNWAPVLEGFKAKYPWITVTTTDLGAYEVFERYYTESAGKARTADFISTAAPDGWINFVSKGEVAAYTSTEDANISEIGKIAPGVYAVSTDPMVFVYNKALLPAPPKTMAELVAMIQADPAKFEGRLVTYDSAGEGFGYGLNWYYTKKLGDAGWKNLEVIGSTKPKILTSGGKMIDSVLSGESILGYFVSNITVQPRIAAAKELLGYSFVPDAEVVVVRGMAVTKNATSPNSAKLLLDYILSADGQLAFAAGGLTAYRDDVADRAALHLSQVSAAVGGADKLIFSRPESEIADKAKHDAFIARWQQALQIQP